MVKKVMTWLLTVCLFLGVTINNPILAEAMEEQQTIATIAVTYGQSEARTMLDDINEFRTSSTDAWAYDEAGNKVYYSGLQPLQYDYELEKVAMKRAAEIAVSFSHTRPNGTSCFTAYPSTISPGGENIAAGYENARSVFIGWREDNKSYEGQGHRRNMLKESLVSIGIGHVKYQGINYWVQEFGRSQPSSYISEAVDMPALEKIEISNDFIKGFRTNIGDICMYEGDNKDLSTLKPVLDVVNYWGIYYNGCMTEDDYKVIVADSNIIQYDNHKLTALKTGETKLSISAYGKTCDIPVTVAKRKDISIGTVYFPSGKTYQYTGNEFKPYVKIIVDNRTLTENKDYTIAYHNNINPGNAEVVVTGIGTYQGELHANFEIVKKQDTNIKPNTPEEQPNQTPTEKPSDTPAEQPGKNPLEDTSQNTEEQPTPTPAKNQEQDKDQQQNSVTKDQQQEEQTEDQPEDDQKFEEDETENINKNTKVSKPARINAVRITVRGKKITVTWSKKKKVDGYQIQYSTNAKFKKGKNTVTKKTKKASFTINNAKKKTYYVKVRTYKKVNGKYVYGNWSACNRIIRL